MYEFFVFNALALKDNHLTNEKKNTAINCFGIQNEFFRIQSADIMCFVNPIQ